MSGACVVISLVLSDKCLRQMLGYLTLSLGCVVCSNHSLRICECESVVEAFCLQMFMFDWCKE